MDLRTFLVNLGKGALREVPVVGDLLAGSLNEVLPADKQVTQENTGEQIMQAIESLPPEIQKEIYSQQVDLKKEEVRADVEMFKTLMAGDDKVSFVRPRIALYLCYLVCYCISAFTTAYLVAVWFENPGVAKELSNSWPMLLALLSFPTTYLLHYVGKRTTEKMGKIAAATGSPVGGVITQLLGLLRKS